MGTNIIAEKTRDISVDSYKISLKLYISMYES
uniref:Uncharacterized protein n=1 Tax=Oryza punctata TaxID=4537 RepID=A0A0E0MGQ4_ORYPU